MAPPRPARRLRRASLWLLITVVVMVSLFSVQRARGLQEERTRLDRARTAQELSNLIGLWEGLVTERIRGWTRDLAVNPAPRARERQLRSAVAWFDAAYVWEVSNQAPAVDFRWPVADAPDDPTALLMDPCLRSANNLRATSRLSAAADAFLACPAPSPAHAAFAAWIAARTLSSLNKHDDALATLEAGRIPLSMPLAQGPTAGVSVWRLTETRVLAVDLLAALGRHDDSHALALDTALELAQLPGADLGRGLPYIEQLIEPIPETSPHLELLAPVKARAERREVAWREVRDRLAAATADAPLDDVHIVHDQYSRPGFLLAWVPVDDSERVAIQVDADQLLASLVDSLPASRGLVVVDTDGRPVHPDGTPTGDEALQGAQSVPLGRLFPRLHLASKASERAVWSGFWAEFLVAMAPLGLSVVFAGLAVMAQVTAERRQQELAHRQQEFITRVTHELKTPLAGIRIMAENLQLGAADDPSLRDQFLDRILSECNNLSARIDEVLGAARRPELGSMVETPANALVDDVLDRWRPRLEQRGVTLETRLDPTPPVSVDLELIGDAVGNLLDNALKYGRPGVRGHIRVRTGTLGRWVVIEVADNGIGVPRDKRREVFTRFTRVEGPGRGKSGGHGLGLAFVAEAAEAHSGLVECVDGIDGGACFRIKLKKR